MLHRQGVKCDFSFKENSSTCIIKAVLLILLLSAWSWIVTSLNWALYSVFVKNWIFTEILALLHSKSFSKLLSILPSHLTSQLCEVGTTGIVYFHLCEMMKLGPGRGGRTYLSLPSSEGLMMHLGFLLFYIHIAGVYLWQKDKHKKLLPAFNVLSSVF